MQPSHLTTPRDLLQKGLSPSPRLVQVHYILQSLGHTPGPLPDLPTPVAMGSHSDSSTSTEEPPNMTPSELEHNLVLVQLFRSGLVRPGPYFSEVLMATEAVAQLRLGR